MDHPPPNGYFVRDLIIYGKLSKGGTAARGFRLYPTDTKGASDERLTELHASLVKLMQSIPLHQRLQWKWRKDSDYREALDLYDAETAKTQNDVIRQHREKTSSHYRELMARKELHREHLVLYVALPIDQAPPLLASKADLKTYHVSVLNQIDTAFQQINRDVDAFFGNELVVRPMDDMEHYLETCLWFQPDEAQHLALLKPRFNPARSIHWNCWKSEISANGTGRIYFGGHYHSIFVLRLLGSNTAETMINMLTKLKHVDYEITITMRPQDTYRAIQEEEDRSRSLQAQEDDDKISSPSRRKTIQIQQQRVEKLTEGHTRPFFATVVIRAWAASDAELAAKTSAIRGGIVQMHNAQCYERHLEFTALALLYSTLPGNAFYPHAEREIKITDEHLANLIPFSASFTGDLESPQALYRSSDGALIGIRYQKFDVPQHSGVLGASRTGKSYWYLDSMLQSAPYFDYEVIVENGLSHLPYSKAFGCDPIIIRRNGNVTLNYLDTGGLPLDQDQLGLAVTQVRHMCGHSQDERINAQRKAYATYYVNTVYQESVEAWQRKNNELYSKVQREACAVHKWLRDKMTANDTAMGAYMDLRDRLRQNDSEALEFIAKVPEREVTLFATQRETAHLVRNHAFAYFKPEEYPQHSELWDLISVRPNDNHERIEVASMADQLREWCSDQGAYGPLFDGVTNRRLDARVLHFELSFSDKTDTTLKSAASLTIAGKVRQIIANMPRSVRKRFSWEEFAADLDVPQNAVLASELVAQFAKMGCTFVYLIQNYSQFKMLPVCDALLGNSSQYFLFRQEDARDVVDLAPRIQLPVSLASAVTGYPKVTNLDPKNRYSSFCYFSKAAHPIIAGSCEFRAIK